MLCWYAIASSSSKGIRYRRNGVQNFCKKKKDPLLRRTPCIDHTLHTTTPHLPHSPTMSLAHLPTLPLVNLLASELDGCGEEPRVVRHSWMRSARRGPRSEGSLLQHRVWRMRWVRYWRRESRKRWQVRERLWRVLRSRFCAIREMTLV